MLLYLSQKILAMAEHTSYETAVSFLRIFKYITFRGAGAAVTALLLSWWLGPKVIHWLKQLKFGQNYADRAAEQGKFSSGGVTKIGVPTMGGLMTLFGAGMYPNLVYSQPSPENSLTVYNAASSQKTLGIMLTIALIGVPIVLAYTVSIYWIFRGRVKLDRMSY